MESSVAPDPSVDQTASRKALMESPMSSRTPGRTIRTVTAELPALTGCMLPGGAERMLAGPEVMIELPRFEGHMLCAPLMLSTAPHPVVIPPPAESTAEIGWWRRLMLRVDPRGWARAR